MVDTQKNLLIAERLLEGRVVGFQHPEPFRLDARVEAADLTAAVRMLFNTEWGYLAAITGLDQEAHSPELEVLYHFCSADAVVTLRLKTGRENPRVPTVSGVIPAAEIFERELSDIFGIQVEGVPGSGQPTATAGWSGGALRLANEIEG